MRRTKPPVGWEHVKNCFPVPNELLDFDLPGGSIAVYIFLLRHADRRTGQCHPSTATMAKNLHYCRNTVASYVRLLEERGLIVTEHTKIITKNGIKKNGNLLCGKEVVIKKTKKGRKYYGCENSPECEFMSWQKPAGINCEKCGSFMVEKGNKIVCSNTQCGHVIEKVKK